MKLKNNLIYKFLRKTFLLGGLFFIALFIFTTLIVTLYSRNIIYSNPDLISSQQTVLILGTSKYALSGEKNKFYTYRIQAALKLFQTQKIKQFIVSGHEDGNYHEPEQMKKDLIAAGVPAEIIIKDNHGNRTIESVLNLQNNYNLNQDIVIVSQNFHLQRALLLAGIYDINAVGFAAKSPPILDGYKTYPREVLARIKMLWDILTIKSIF